MSNDINRDDLEFVNGEYYLPKREGVRAVYYPEPEEVGGVKGKGGDALPDAPHFRREWPAW